MARVAPFAWFFAAGFAALAPAQEPAPAAWVRVLEHDGGGQLDVRLANYRKGDATLALIGSIHVADREHYAELQRRFAGYEVVLYELVADADARPYPAAWQPAGLDDPLGWAFERAAAALHLDQQVACLDYRHAHLVHADLTPAEFEAALASRGSNLWLELMANGPRSRDDRPPSLDLVAAFRAGDGPFVLRKLVARVLGELDTTAAPPTVVIDARNERCLDVLARELAAGRKQLAIYYGAAHMPQFERRLVQDLGWTRTGDEWLRAWDNARERFPPAAPRGTQQKRYRAAREIAARTAALGRWLQRRPGEEPTFAMTSVERAPTADDPWGRPYALRETPRGYEVRSAGADGAFDTADDVATSPAQRVGGGFAELLHVRRAREQERAASLARMRDAPRRDVAEFERQAALLRQERAEPALAGGPLAAVFTAVDATLAETRAVSLLAVAAEVWRREKRAPTLAELRLDWLAGRGSDPWGRPYRIAEAGPDVLAVRSNGPDGVADNGDDIVVTAPAVERRAK